MMIYHLLETLSDTVGIIGVILLLFVYFLLSTNRISSKQISYQLYNLIGASCILFSLFFHFNLASILLEFAWVGISLIGIYKIRIEAKNEKMKVGNNE
jgi:cell division protein FtsW (lipid II flippase)